MTITVRLPRFLKMLKHCLQDEINKPVIGYITWIVFINIELWTIRVMMMSLVWMKAMNLNTMNIKMKSS